MLPNALLLTADRIRVGRDGVVHMARVGDVHPSSFRLWIELAPEVINAAIELGLRVDAFGIHGSVDGAKALLAEWRPGMAPPPEIRLRARLRTGGWALRVTVGDGIIIAERTVVAGANP